MDTRLFFGAALSSTLVAMAVFVPETSAQTPKPKSSVPAPAPSLTYAQKKLAAEAAIRGRYACTSRARYTETPIGLTSHLAGAAGFVQTDFAYDLEIQDGSCRVDLARVGTNANLRARYQVSPQNPSPVFSAITGATCTLTPDSEARPKVDVTFAVGPVRVHGDQTGHPASGASPGVVTTWLNDAGDLALTFYYDAPATMMDSAHYFGTVCKRLP